MSGVGNAVQVEIAHHRTDLIQFVGRWAMGRIVIFAPQDAELAGHVGEVGR